MFDKEKMEEEMRKWSWGGEGSEEEGAMDVGGAVLSPC